MKNRIAIFILVGLLVPTLSAPPAAAATPTNGVIVRVANRQVAVTLCSIPLPPLLLPPCIVVRALDGTIGQLFLIVPVGITASQLLNMLLGPVGGYLGVIDAELDQTLNIITSDIGGLIAPANLNDMTRVDYYGTSASNGYTTQPAVGIINLPKIQSQVCSPNSCGTGIVADIDTGVDPHHPVLQGALLQGYDFTRDEAGGDEMRDIVSDGGVVIDIWIALTTAVQLNPWAVAVLNWCPTPDVPYNVDLCSQPYRAFGHGTMVSGIIHLVAPTAKIMPLKVFRADGQGQLSDVLRAIYYGTQSGANIVNMSFDTKTPSTELSQALSYASSQGVVSVASAGDDGKQFGNGFEAYPASLSTVMTIASTSNSDTLSLFSNYGKPPVWVGAPGEGIVSTYPFGTTYAAGWGTSFSAAFVSGTVALMRQVSSSNLNQQTAAQATCHAVNIGNAGVGFGRLDAYDAVTAWSEGAGPC